MNIGGRTFREIWVVDFEYAAPDGETPKPHCMVAREVLSDRTRWMVDDDLRNADGPRFATDAHALVVCFYAPAEWSCFLALGWALPANVLDLYVEFRALTNGRTTPCGNGLLGAMAYFDIAGIAEATKDSMRDLAIRGPSTDREWAALLAYCESDVSATVKLLRRMAPDIDIGRALLRGRYTKAAAQIERSGVPIDVPMLTSIRDDWLAMQGRLIAEVDADYGVFDGYTFKADRWAAFLTKRGIAWPMLPSGALALDRDTFRDMARSYPVVGPIRELRVSLSEMRLESLAVGADGRNRTMLSIFRSKTGRNQPSNTKFIFGPATWIRSLIKPGPGQAIAYIDWSQQEHGIAAALSGDTAMMAAYESGDPYMEFAKQAGAVPPDATKRTHGHVRDQFKACALAVQYGMGPEALANRIGQPPIVGRELLRRHRETYRRFWKWSQAAVDTAMLYGTIRTAFGWPIHVGEEVNPRSLSNFPMQANGAEMLRLGCIFATERGIKVCAPIHDAILIEAPTEHIEDAVVEAQRAMSDASALVLSGFRLRSDASIVRHPDRYVDERGRRMWETVQKVLGEVSERFKPGAQRTSQDETQGGAPWDTNPPHGGTPVQSYISYTYKGTTHHDIPAERLRPTGRAVTEDETIQETSEAEIGWEVSERTDSAGVATHGGPTSGQGDPPRCGPLVPGRDCQEARGQGELRKSDRIRRPSSCGLPQPGEIGEREAHICEAPSGAQPGRDTPGRPPGLTPEQHEEWLERVAVMEFGGGLSREDAEREALAACTEAVA